ncbi:MAG TPA: sensor histidine kinase, partial [Vicingus sp.]|nr:sensor histidine kinase [Vicingus sp.]
EKIGNIVAEAQGRIKTMAIIHEMLYQTDDIANIQLQNYAQLLVNSIESGFVSKTAVNKSFDLNNVRFNIDTIIPLGLILNELVSNAYKYVFVPNYGNLLSISIKKVEQENWQLTIKDDGKGISNNGVGEREGSFGLKLVRMLARQLKGKVEYSYENGSKFCITFKELNFTK